MPVDAVSLSGIYGRRATAPKDVLLPGDRLKVSRVDTPPIPTEMIELQAGGNRTIERFPDCNMGTIGAVRPATGPLAVSFLADIATPHPAAISQGDYQGKPFW
jgi:hypothetical protein